MEHFCNFLSILREKIGRSQSKALEEASEHQAKEAWLLDRLESAQKQQRNAAHKCEGEPLLRCILLIQALLNDSVLVTIRTGAEATENGRRASCERSQPERKR